jgi:hypothetical protein
LAAKDEMNIKIGQISIISGVSLLSGSLLILLLVPTSPLAPLTGSISIIFIMYGIFSMKDYNTLLFAGFSSIFLLIGAFWSYYNTSLPVNAKSAPLFYIFIVLIVLGMIFLVYRLTRELKSRRRI